MSIIIIFFIGMMYDADIIGMILAKKTSSINFWTTQVVTYTQAEG